MAANGRHPGARRTSDFAAKGDYANAALSAAAMIPVGGQAATAAKLGMKGANALADAARTTARRGGTCPIGNSFVVGTRVLMADGSTKPIEDVEVGDLVLATDPVTGESSAEPVTALITGNGSKQLVRIGADPDHNGDTDWLTATEGHPFWVQGEGWVDAEALDLGDLLVSDKGEQIQISRLDDHTSIATVHNLTVDRTHTYYVQIGAERRALVQGLSDFRCNWHLAF